MADDNETILARLKVQNRAGFVGDMRAASKAVLGFGLANEEAAAELELSKVESFAFRQGLYTLRRELFYSTAAVLGGTGALLHLGFAFDNARQEGTTAFTAILGSTSAARREMASLTNVSLETGLQLSTISDAAKTMQSFGFGVRAVNIDVKALGDFAQKSGGNLNTLVDVFDQIQQQGKLTSRNLLTLTSNGVPALAFLRRQLHLTAGQAAALQQGKLIIPARYALPALAAGIQARANVLGPNLGQEVGRTHARLAAIFGAGEQGIFSGATGLLDRFNAALDRGIAGMRGGGGVRGLLMGIDPSGRLLLGWKILKTVIDDVTGAIRILWMVLGPVVGIFSWLIGGLSQVAKRYGFLTPLVWGLAAAMKVLIAIYLLDRSRLVAVWAAQKLLNKEMLVSATLTRAWAAAQFLLDAAMTPEFAIVALIVGVAAGLYLLVTRVKAVREAFVTVFRDIKRVVVDAIDFLIKGWNLLHFHVGAFSAFGHHFGGFNVGVTPIPLLANGGNVLPGATAVVGDAGPELLSNRGGVAQVVPLSRHLQNGNGGSLLNVLVEPLTIKVYDKVLAEISFKAKQQREALA